MGCLVARGGGGGAADTALVQMNLLKERPLKKFGKLHLSSPNCFKFISEI